jgi:hypothetical protein
MDPAAGPTHINPPPIHSPAADLPNQIYTAQDAASQIDTTAAQT